MPDTAPSRLRVSPGRSLAGAFRPPGDKSVTHRAFILGALAEGNSRIEGANPGEDCARTLACIEALGASVGRDGGTIAIQGRAMRWTEPERPLDCGNSGTSLRLLAGPLAAQPFLSVLTGDASLSRRPVDRVIEPLRRMGAELHARAEGRYPPLVIRGNRLAAIRHRLPMPSAQVASCVLLAGLFAEGRTIVELAAARDHTERMLPLFGAEVERSQPDASGVSARAVRGPVTLHGAALRVPADFSAAAFFLVAAAIHPRARVTALGVSLNPTRIGLLSTLERMGARVEVASSGEAAGEPVGDVTVEGPDLLNAVDVRPDHLPAMIDEVPAWAVAAAHARGVSRLSGAQELRVKESDRLSALSKGLGALGIEVLEREGGLEIRGGRAQGGDVAACGDHRIAMALAVLGTAARAPITVHESDPIATSFPAFAAVLRELGGEVEDLDARHPMEQAT